jgi:hypothetical protein
MICASPLVFIRLSLLHINVLVGLSRCVPFDYDLAVTHVFKLTSS